MLEIQVAAAVIRLGAQHKSTPGERSPCASSRSRVPAGKASAHVVSATHNVGTAHTRVSGSGAGIPTGQAKGNGYEFGILRCCWVLQAE